MPTVNIFNFRTKAWNTTQLSVARMNLAATSVGGKAFFAGGGTLLRDDGVVDVYDCSTYHWAAPLRLSSP